MRRSTIAALILAGTALAAPATSQTAPPPAAPDKPQMGSYGFDVAGMDTSVKPGVDFYEYASGGWERTTPIPADRSGYGMFHLLQDQSLERTRAILEDAARTPGGKIGDLYASFMDEAAIEARGAAPLKPWLDRLAGARDKTALAVAAASLQRQGVPGLFSFYVNQDNKAPDTYAPVFRQGGLGLPDRDFYLKDDAKLEATRTAYRAYLAQLLTLAGEADPVTRADAVFAMEKALATGHWTRIESRDEDRLYNRMTAADLAVKAPGFPWAAYFAELGMANRPFYLIGQPSAFTAEAKVFADTPIDVVRDYYRLRMLNDFAPYLSSAFDKAAFAFNGTTLSGQPQQAPRWKRGVSLVTDAMGEEVGKTYVARHFPPAAKAEMDRLVANVRAAMGDRLRTLEWMAPETRAKAVAKLASFRPKIGYPDQWRDYGALKVARGDLAGNVARANAFEFERNIAKLGKPVDRDEWFMTPMTINAYANATMNEIVFSAAILQPPFFDPAADAAINYGAIGAVIGHELSHHFDDQGRKYDPTGRLSEWWTPEDVARFKTFTDRLVKQYDAYEALPGQHVQGALTLGENIADLAGLTVAHAAYQKSLGGKPAPVIGGLTGDQRFYLGWAQIWRAKYREPFLRQILLSDPHSPGRQRAAIVRNLDGWYAAFKVAPGDALYLAPEERVRIW